MPRTPRRRTSAPRPRRTWRACCATRRSRRTACVSEAEAVLERKTAEAEEAAARIRRQADEMLQQARIDADADAEQGRERGREMVTEAQRVRERMLRDLVRRRKTLSQQIEQLNAGRERLIEAYAVVRQALDTATNELDIVLPEAKVAADNALQRAIDVRHAQRSTKTWRRCRSSYVSRSHPLVSRLPRRPRAAVAATDVERRRSKSRMPAIAGRRRHRAHRGGRPRRLPRAPGARSGRGAPLERRQRDRAVPRRGGARAGPRRRRRRRRPRRPSPPSRTTPPSNRRRPSTIRTAWPARRPGWPTCSPGSSTRRRRTSSTARPPPASSPPTPRPAADDQVDPDADELPLAERYALVVRELERSLARHVKRELVRRAERDARRGPS